MKNAIVLFPIIVLLLSACQPGKVKTLEASLESKTEQLALLQQQLGYEQATNTSLLQTLSDLSVINKSDAQSIQASLESLNKQNEYIRDLTDKIHEKDSINFALVSNLKRSLIDVDDEDIHVEVRGSAVYVSIADKMLFSTASSRISERAYSILEKVARVINDHADLDIMIEGHTDNVPISNQQYLDNWDLSVSRATAVTRILQERFKVDPSRMTAAGRASYRPRNDNATQYDRSANRRTEIIITPKLDQFFKLLEYEELVG